MKKEVVIYELTSPFEKNIHIQHKYKCDKYAHFETDIKSHKTTVVAFEVGARGGLTDQNITRFTNMHKQHLHKHIQKNTFLLLHLHSKKASTMGAHNTNQPSLLIILTDHKTVSWSSESTPGQNLRLYLPYCTTCGMAPFIVQ